MKPECGSAKAQDMHCRNNSFVAVVIEEKKSCECEQSVLRHLRTLGNGGDDVEYEDLPPGKSSQNCLKASL